MFHNITSFTSLQKLAVLTVTGSDKKNSPGRLDGKNIYFLA